MKQTFALLALLAWPFISFSQPTQTQKTNQKKVSAESDLFDKSFYKWAPTLSEAIHTLKARYIKEIDPQEAMIDAIKALVSRDPHSQFLDPKTYKDILESTGGEFFGIGIIIAPKAVDEEFLAVIDTIPDGPADKAGLRAGDKLIEIDNVALRGINTDEATTKLKGERNSIVHIKIMREGNSEPMAFDIARNVVKEKNSLCYYFKDQDVYYLYLSTFSHTAVKQLSDLLKKSQKNPYKGLILDLRNNGGGLLNSAVDIASLFVDKGSTIVMTKDRNNKIVDKYATETAPIASNATPIFILINNYTASAAEILAGSLKIYSEKIAQESGNKKQSRLLVFIVGTKSWGKGSVQEVIPLSNDCAIKLTISLYYLPDDNTVQGVGIEPDIEIEKKFPPSAQMVWLNQFYGRENTLKNSIKTKPEEKKAKPTKTPEKNWKEQKKDMLAADTQLRETLSCISILNLCPNSWRTRIDAIKLLKTVFSNTDKLTIQEVEI